MGGSERKLSGPDFKNGVSLNQLAKGQKLLGHADGEAVLLVREDDSIYAVGATCTHYGADLNEGIVADGTVRCPWHHACFDYKTGEAQKGPALNPIPTWKVEIQNEIVYVREKNKRTAPKHKTGSARHFVIVGSGAAGHAAAETLRRKGFAGQITVVTDDSDFPYDRPNLSKDYLAGNAPEEWMALRSPEYYQEQNIEFRLKSKVNSLDVAGHVIRLENGSEFKFDKCLLATGGSPSKPPIEGLELPHVHFLRSMAQCRSILLDLKSAKKIVIVGSGFIGLEAAAALRSRGLEVTIATPHRLPLSHIFGHEVATLLKTAHESHGVVFKSDHTVSKIDQSSVHLSNKSKIDADLVLVATGITPNTVIAEQAGLKCDNGILVNTHLETSTKDIYAAGDVACYPGAMDGSRHRIEHWAVAQRQGQVAALNMLGEPLMYNEVPFFWSQQFDLSLSYVGTSKNWQHMKIFGNLNHRDGAVAYYENEKIAAVLTIGRDKLSLYIEHAFEKNDQSKILSYLNLG